MYIFDGKLEFGRFRQLVQVCSRLGGEAASVSGSSRELKTGAASARTYD